MALKQMKEQSFSIISEDQVIEQDKNSKKKTKKNRGLCTEIENWTEV